MTANQQIEKLLAQAADNGSEPVWVARIAPPATTPGAEFHTAERSSEVGQAMRSLKMLGADPAQRNAYHPSLDMTLKLLNMLYIPGEQKRLLQENAALKAEGADNPMLETMESLATGTYAMLRRLSPAVLLNPDAKSPMQFAEARTTLLTALEHDFPNHLSAGKGGLGA